MLLRSRKIAKVEHREREGERYTLRKRGREEPDHTGLQPRFGTWMSVHTVRGGAPAPLSFKKSILSLLTPMLETI